MKRRALSIMISLSLILALVTFVPESLAEITYEEVITLTYNIGGFYNVGAKGLLAFSGTASDGTYKYGLFDFINNRVIIPLTYDYIGEYYNGQLAHVSRDGKIGYIDITGKEVVPCEYSHLYWGVFDGMVMVSKEGEGNSFEDSYFDITGREIIPAGKYDDMDIRYRDGYLRVGIGSSLDMDRKYTLVDTSGKEITTFKYDYIDYFKDGLVRVTTPPNEYGISAYGYIDKTGKEVIPLKYSFASNFYDGVAFVKTEALFDYYAINNNGNVLYKISDSLLFFDRYFEGYLPYKQMPSGTAGLMDLSGKIIVPPKYDDLDYIGEGICKFVKNGVLGIVDFSGKEIMLPQFSRIDKCMEGLIFVRNGDLETGLYGLIDKNGKEVVPLKYDIIYDFEDGLAQIQTGSKRGIFRLGGIFIIPEQVPLFETDRASFYEGEYGYINTSGDEVIPSGKYAATDAIFSKDNLALMFSDKGSYLVNREGIEIYKFPSNSDIDYFPEDDIYAIKSTELFGDQYPRLVRIKLEPIDTAHDWAKESIISAIAKGFVPKDLQNNYTDTITRLDFCRLAVKFMEYATGKTIDDILAEKGLQRESTAFTDVTNTDVLAAYALGITSGSGEGTFTPNGQFTRESAAQMIMNVRKALGYDVSNPPPSGFADADKISSWTKAGVDYCVSAGIMSGGSGKPLSNNNIYNSSFLLRRNNPQREWHKE